MKIQSLSNLSISKKLKTIYYSDLKDLKSKIVDAFANDRTPPQHRIRKLTLSDGELKKLNSTGAVEIDLNQHILLDSDRGATIREIQVDTQNTKISQGSKSSNSQIAITFERSNFSIIRWGNKDNYQDYYFEYGGSKVEVSPVIGGFNWSYSPHSGGQFKPHNPINNVLLSNMSDSQRIYTQPGARTILKINREDIGNSARVDIQNLVLDVHLEAYKLF